ncbi:MAG: hypothetical protein K6G30_06025 [Acetatifactor sp.]|nr:hypothetical protein [Acetatifactor sp.]
MIYQEIEFHNVDHLEQVEGMAGVRIERFPAFFSRELGMGDRVNGRFRTRRVHGCELRFITEAPYYDLCLMAVEEDVDVIVYYGDMMHSKHTLKAGVSTVLHVEYPPVYKDVDITKLPGGRFAPWVWRILLGMNGNVYYQYLDTYGYGRRPPRAEEKPEILWAAYGSSITCGSVTTLYSNSYIEQAAMQLGIDVMNKGLSGSCFLEPIVGKYLATLEVNVLSLEVGVNMLPFITPDLFEERLRNFLHLVGENPTVKKIYVIDLFANRGPILLNHENGQYLYYDSFREVVKKVVGESGDDRFTCVNGKEVARDMTYLSVDLLHPSDQGHIRMGQNLADCIWKDMSYVKK